MSFLSSKVRYVKVLFRNIYCTGIKYNSKDSPSAKESRSVVTPYVCLDPVLNCRETFESNLSRRGISVDTEELIQLWNTYVKLLKDRSNVEIAREENRSSLIKIKSEKSSSTDVTELKSLGKNLRGKSKEISGNITRLENVLIPRILSLPNRLDPEVSDDEVTIDTFLEPSSNEFDHLSTGKQLGLLKYFNPYLYFFEGAAAKYELAICKWIVNIFGGLNFVRLSNPDFSRVSLVEGWIDKDSDKHLLSLSKSFQTGHDRLHLNGGAHFLMFCALFVNSIVESGHLPLKYVCQGRLYLPPSLLTKGLPEALGLHSVVQNTAVSFFIGTVEKFASGEFKDIVDKIWDLYKSLNLPVRLVEYSSSQLMLCESRKISIQLFLSYNKRFVEVGNVCKTDDFVSKRLRIYSKDNSDLNFINIIHGNVVKVPVLIACLLENHPEKVLALLEQHLSLFEV